MRRLASAILALVLSTSGCVLYTDSYYDHHYRYECDSYVYSCGFCHHYHTGPCGRPVYVVRCGHCYRYHTGVCVRVRIR